MDVGLAETANVTLAPELLMPDDADKNVRMLLLERTSHGQKPFKSNLNVVLAAPAAATEYGLGGVGVPSKPKHCAFS